MNKVLLSFIVLFLLFTNSAFSNISDSLALKSNISKVVDINGNTHTLKNKICVFIFLDLECPISQYYTQTLQNLFLTNKNSAVLFFTVFPTKYTSSDDIIYFNQKYNLTIPSVLDKFQSITKKMNASITPEVFVINKSNQILYSGSIDDSYFAIGKRNHAPKKFYLAEALNLVINNKKPLISHSEAIGCEIQRMP